MSYPLFASIADAIHANSKQVQTAVQLLDDGATVPFIARYRKEATQNLDDQQLRQLETLLIKGRELEARRSSILSSLTKADKLTPELQDKITQADNLTRLEDLYAPFKPKRVGRAAKAIEAGLSPLADELIKLNPQSPDELSALASPYLSEEKGYPTEKSVLDGATWILVEKYAQDADLLEQFRDQYAKEGILVSSLNEAKKHEKEAQRFENYFTFQEAISSLPSHRILALFRGRRLEFLTLACQLPDEPQGRASHPMEGMLRAHFAIPRSSFFDRVIRLTWKGRLLPSIETAMFETLKTRAEEGAYTSFKTNLNSMLMASPAGEKVILGLDPGLRTGVKATVIDEQGELKEWKTVFPHPPQKDWAGALASLKQLCVSHQVSLIAIGNGTGNRETEQLATEVCGELDQDIQWITVSEAGASVYSASEVAAEEFPNLDVSYRGAVSIARRLQDPLSELVKIEPKSLGVGQYQHDVNQHELTRNLNAVVEDCVNLIGVDVNRASAAILQYIAGLSASQAKSLVLHRSTNGPFQNRKDILQVAGIGEKAWQQAIGFLRIYGHDPLDETGVHPEWYETVNRIASAASLPLSQLINNPGRLGSIKAQQFTSETIGSETIKDILLELGKPQRDPRPQFKTMKRQHNVTTLADLKPNLILEGRISNITDFGAFVDIGVHQDGLVHVSQMANKFIKHPSEVVKTGDFVQVKVMEVDINRKRIGLSMKLDEKAENVKKTPSSVARSRTATQTATAKKPQASSMQSAFEKALRS